MLLTQHSALNQCTDYSSEGPGGLQALETGGAPIGMPFAVLLSAVRLTPGMTTPA
jgi:hypothetical protein